MSRSAPVKLGLMEIEHTVSEDGEEWTHEVEDDILGVSVTRDEGVYQVFVGAAEFVREEPLEGRLRSAVAAALSNVKGVQSVFEEDREVWVVEGRPSGEELARAAGDAVRILADELRAHVEQLGEE